MRADGRTICPLGIRAPDRHTDVPSAVATSAGSCSPAQEGIRQPGGSQTGAPTASSHSHSGRSTSSICSAAVSAVATSSTATSSQKAPSGVQMERRRRCAGAGSAALALSASSSISRALWEVWCSAGATSVGSASAEPGMGRRAARCSARKAQSVQPSVTSGGNSITPRTIV